MAHPPHVKLCGWIAFIILPFFINESVCGEQITEKIYRKIDHGFSCFRRLNGTHQIGCSSGHQSGNVGVIHLIENDADIDWLINVGPHSPYTALMMPDTFRRNNVMKLKNSGKLSGIVVLNGTSSHTPSHYSNDLTCPNKYSGLYKDHLSSHRWNPWGDGLLFDDIDFPVFFINETSFSQSVLLDCFYKFNKPSNGDLPSYPLCSIELKAFMWASVNTPTCLRRGQLNMLLNPQPSEFCDPLGSFNIFVPLLPVDKDQGETKNRSVILVTARMDSVSLFDDLALGADTAITGSAALIVITDLLRQVQSQIRDAGLVDNVFLVLFQGEAFDYIGSQRMVYDMLANKFPHPLRDDNPLQSPLVNLHHIRYFIELGSLADYGNPTIYAHTDPLSNSDSGVASQVETLIDILRENQGNISVERVDKQLPLPPSSFQSFLTKDNAIPGVVITNFRNEFTNQFYNSEWDTSSKFNVGRLGKHLADVVLTVASTVYQMATEKKMPADIKPNSTLIDEILECYLINANCTLFNRLLNSKSRLFAEGPLSTYVGTQQVDDIYKPLVLRTKHLMALVSGHPVVDLNRTSCFGNETDEIFHYYWMGESEMSNITGQCYRSTVKTSLASSPAFEIEGYDWTSGEYSSWTESRWETFSIRIFLKPSLAQEWTIFSLGLMVLFLSTISIYWINKNSNVLFQNNRSNGVC